MAIDTSIYSNVQPVQIQQTNPLDSAYKAMAIGKLSMEQAGMQRQLQNQQAMADAYTKNMNPDGSLDQQGYLSELGKTAPIAAMEAGPRMAEMQKQMADAKIADAQSKHAQLSLVQPVLNHIGKYPEDQRAAMWPDAMKQLASMGISTALTNAPAEYDKNWFDATRDIVNNSKEGLENQLTQANIGKTQSEIGEKATNKILESQKILSGNKEYEKFTGQIYSGQSALAAIDDALKNPGSRGMLPITLARFATGDQRINGPEIEAFFKGLPPGDKLRQVYDQTASGTLSPKVADEAKQYLITQMQAASASKKAIEQDGAAKYSMISGAPANVAYARLTGKAPGTGDNIPPSPARFANGGSPPSDSTSPGLLSSLGNAAGKMMFGGNAGAATQAPAAPALPPGMIRMQMPSTKGQTGKIKLVPIGMKGQAIEAGGTVVP